MPLEMLLFLFFISWEVPFLGSLMWPLPLALLDLALEAEVEAEEGEEEEELDGLLEAKSL